jgi:hypothetical protein
VAFTISREKIMTDQLYSARPFVSHAGPDGNGFREEVLVTKGRGTVVGISKENASSVQVEINVPTLKYGNLNGWLNKYIHYDDAKSADEQEINPEYQLALDAINDGFPVDFRIEHQRRKKTKRDKDPIDPKTPIYELMGADENGSNKQMNLVGDTTVKLLVGLGRPGEHMLFTQDTTDPAEDPDNSGPTSARLSGHAERATPQRHSNGFNEVQPWVGQNPSGEVNPGSYAVDASIDFFFWLKDYALTHNVDGLEGKRVRILAIHLVRLADDLQLAIYNDRLDAPDRNIGSYREVRSIIKKTIDCLCPLTNDDVASKDAIKTWIQRVYDLSLDVWKWAVEDYAESIDVSPYGEDE